MAKVTANPLPNPMRPADLGDKETAVFTVREVMVDVKTEGTRRGKATIIIPVEMPEKGIYLNETSKANCLVGFKSDDSDDWCGKLVPVMVVQSEDPRAKTDPTVPKYSKKIWVAPPEQWAKMIGSKKPRTE